MQARERYRSAAFARALHHGKASANENKFVYLPKSRELHVLFVASYSRMVFTQACQREFEVCGLHSRRFFWLAGGSDWARDCF